MTVMTAAPDLAAIKQRQQATWSSGDYHMIGTQILIVSELMIEALDVHSTERVLDVATGSGNAALAAARRGCDVVGVDYVPSLLDRARRRTEAEGLEDRVPRGRRRGPPLPRRQLRCRELGLRGDVRARPGADGERARAGDPLGRPDRARGAYAGRVHRPAVQDHRAPRAAAGGPALADPVGHGRSGSRSSSATRSPSCAPRSATTRSASARPRRSSTTGAATTARRSRRSKPWARTGHAALEADIVDLIEQFNRADDGTMVVPSEYLEAVIVTR